jgi:hypothetical protein
MIFQFQKVKQKEIGFWLVRHSDWSMIGIFVFLEWSQNIVHACSLLNLVKNFQMDWYKLCD